MVLWSVVNFSPYYLFGGCLSLSNTQFDTNGDGAISISELRDAMRKLLGQQVRVRLLLRWLEYISMDILKLLPLYHKVHNFALTASYVFGILAYLKNAIVFPQVCPKDLEDILRDVDLNGDGLVDFEGKSLPSQRSVVVLPVSNYSSLSCPLFFRVRTDDVSIGRTEWSHCVQLWMWAPMLRVLSHPKTLDSTKIAWTF